MIPWRLLVLLFLPVWTSAERVHMRWNITWVTAAPDGFARPMIGINDAWPCPQLDLNLGDTLIVDVHNSLGNQSTGIHWHGLHQNGTSYMDGAVGATQCPIPPGGDMRYEFELRQTGTYWYHSHVAGQYPDGLRGVLIVHDPSPPVKYDREITITLGDHYHKQMPELLSVYKSVSNEQQHAGHEPLPDVALINEAVGPRIPVEPNQVYLVHLVCVGNWPGHAIIFDSHTLTVVQVDGVWVDPFVVREKHIRITTGQRLSVLITTKEDTSRNYAIWDTMDINMMFIYENRSIPAGFNPNATAWLVYNESAPLPPPPDIHDLDAATSFVDDLIFKPTDHEPPLEPVDRQIILDTNETAADGSVGFSVNGIPYTEPEIPSLYTALAAGPETASQRKIYGSVNPLQLKYGEIVEIVINNYHDNLHPWHLHGHHFQVIQRTAVDGGYFDGYWTNISTSPVKRDTVMVQNHGHAVIRFRADNPDKSYPSFFS